MTLDSILIQPVLTEKSNHAREAGWFAFKVDARANKYMIMGAVEKMFSVHPERCRIINVKPKPRKLRGAPGLTSTWKKALVKLPKGETIAVFEGA